MEKIYKLLNSEIFEDRLIGVNLLVSNIPEQSLLSPEVTDTHIIIKIPSSNQYWDMQIIKALNYILSFNKEGEIVYFWIDWNEIVVKTTLGAENKLKIKLSYSITGK